MYTLNLSQVLSVKTELTAGVIRMLELFKLPQQAKPYKARPDKSSTAHLLHMIETGQTVFKIGTQEASTIYFLSQKVGDAGRVIAFERHPALQAYLTEIKHLFRWNNVTIDDAPVSKVLVHARSLIKEKAAPAKAKVVSFNIPLHKAANTPQASMNLDQYCTEKGLYPHILCLDADGDELTVLQGALHTLQTHRPRIIVSCEERKAGREKILSLFRFLKDLGYKGSFMLDSMLLPLDNFDFSTYQNPQADFYCSHFMFS